MRSSAVAEIPCHDTIRYDRPLFTYVRSKADKKASLVYRTAQKQKIKEKLQTKTD